MCEPKKGRIKQDSNKARRNLCEQRITWTELLELYVSRIKQKGAHSNEEDWVKCSKANNHI